MGKLSMKLIFRYCDCLQISDTVQCLILIVQFLNVNLLQKMVNFVQEEESGCHLLQGLPVEAWQDQRMPD